MSILKKQMPSFTPTKGHTWPILYDPTMKEGSKKAGGGTTVGGSVDGSAMDIDTPTPAGGPQESPVRPGQGHPSSSTNAAGQVSVTVPLLNAIRTTAAHVQRKAASRAQPADGQKRIIRSAMSIGLAMSPSSPDEVVASPTTVAGSSGPNVPQLHKIKTEDAATHASVSAKRVTSPQAGMSSQFSGADGGTPVGERARKKKKRSKYCCSIAQSLLAGDLFLRSWDKRHPNPIIGRVSDDGSSLNLISAFKLKEYTVGSNLEIN